MARRQGAHDSAFRKLGSPAHTANITHAKMPRLALASQAPLAHNHPSSAGGGSARSRGIADYSNSEGYPHTARSNPKFTGGLAATSAGPYTERLGERDTRRPLAFDMRDVPSSRGSSAFSPMDRVRTAPTISQFKMSEVQRVSASSLQTPSELDNWPSSNSQASNSWLHRLEHFLEVRLSMAADNEAKMLAYHECFAQFGELFKLYRPLLARIHQAYDEHIQTSKSSSIKIAQVESELFALQEHAQEQVRKSAVSVTEQLAGMKASVAKANREKAELAAELADTRKQLEEARKEVEHRTEMNDKIQEQARAFCSGYRWLLKNVVKTEEPNDMDALESVTLIQKLERAQAESFSQQQQIRYYTSAAEVVYVQNILEEERKAYAVETDRLTEELEQVRNLESDCRSALEASTNKCKELEAHVEQAHERLDNTFMLHLGDGADIVSAPHSAC